MRGRTFDLRNVLLASAIFLVAGLIAGVGLAALWEGTGQTDPAVAGRSAVPGEPVGGGAEAGSPEGEIASMRATLDRSAAAAGKKFKGEVEAAVLKQGWPAPVGVNADGKHKLWSLAKPVVAVALIEVGAERGVPDYMRSALTGSSNCGQRIAVNALQEKKKSPGRTVDAVQRMLGQAGISVDPPTEIDTPADGDLACDGFPPEQVEGTDGVAPKFGTSRWTTIDAARFAAALAEGESGPYPRSAEAVMRVMRAPKEASPDVGALSTPEAPDRADDWDFDWGAGAAFPRWKPAFKSGWGGVSSDDRGSRYLASQLAALDVEGAPVGVAVTFYPDAQPVDDAIGRSEEQLAIEFVMKRIGRQLAK